MSDETFRHGGNTGPGAFEREDLSSRAVFGFLTGLGIAGVVIYFIVAGVYSYLDRYEREHQPPPNPLVRVAPTDTRVATQQEANQFPQPRLETNEREQLSQQRRQEEEVLNSYGWVDQKAGITHIPIDRAMALIAQRGLPTAPPTAAAVQGAARKTAKAGGKPPVQP